MQRKWAITGLGLVIALVIVATAWLFRGNIALALVARGAEQTLSKPTIDGLKTGLHAAFCGTGSPVPDRTRAGPCVGVIAGGRLFVFDVGEGAAETLNLMGIPPARAEAVFLTHLHSDHLDGLSSFGLLRWTGAKASAPLPLYGPEGTQRVANGLREAYAIDSTYRVAHHGTNIVPPGGYGFEAKVFPALPIGSQAVVYDQGGVQITAFGVDHGPVQPSLGYRVTFQGRSIVISGDTKACDCVAKMAQGVDLLIHEALSPRLTRVLGEAAGRAGQANTAQILSDIENYHTTPKEVATLAKGAGVKAIALTHIVPAIPLKALEPVFLDGAGGAFDGPLWVMADGDLVSIDASGRISKRNVLALR